MTLHIRNLDRRQTGDDYNKEEDSSPNVNSANKIIFV